MNEPSHSSSLCPLFNLLLLLYSIIVKVSLSWCPSQKSRDHFIPQSFPHPHHPVSNSDFTKIYQDIFLFFLSLFIYFEREGGSTWGKGRKRGREREFQEGPTLSVQNPVWGSNSWTARSWPEPKSRVGCLTDWATQGPLQDIFLSCSYLPYFYSHFSSVGHYYIL